MSVCPCGSGQDFDACCGPYIAGEASAPTAEALMRSRYSAIATGNVRYMHDTLAPEATKDYDPAETEAWSRTAEWLGLEVLDTEKGGETDTEGTVEFIARFHLKGDDHAHHEKAIFRREGKKWLYVDGITPKPKQRIVGQKIGRNDPCPCGSGKKYKKCCGAT